MKERTARALAGLIAASGTSLALAQQPPSFAPAHLTGNGPRAIAANCAACHGTAGRPAAGSSMEPLAGRSQGEIMRIMGEFKDGKRGSTVMQQIAKGFSDAEIAAIGLYFEQQR